MSDTRTTGHPCVLTEGAWNVNVEKNSIMPIDPVAATELRGKEKSGLHYTSESYQKILDYHVSEILLTTIVFGVILLIRLYH